MSIWSDMEDVSAGTTVKEEDKILSKEDLSYLIITSDALNLHHGFITC